jgi:hypothetical protein
MKRTYAVVVAGAVLGFVMGCGNSLEPLEMIELRTEVEPSVAAVGDLVTLRAIMRNPTAEMISTSRGCGPPVLFELRAPGRDVVHPIPLGSAFDCPLRDYHELEPLEVDTVVTQWRAGLSAAVWSVHSGFRDGAGLRQLTPAVQLTIN